MLTAQVKDSLQFAVTTKALSAETLEQFELTENEVEDILLVQNELRAVNEETRIEMNLIKAQITKLLYQPDPDLDDVDELLEKASGFRLEQEKNQVRAYVHIREILGEENWTELARLMRRPAPSAQRDDNAFPRRDLPRR